MLDTISIIVNVVTILADIAIIGVILKRWR